MSNGQGRGRGQDGYRRRLDIQHRPKSQWKSTNENPLGYRRRDGDRQKNKVGNSDVWTNQSRRIPDSQSVANDNNQSKLVEKAEERIKQKQAEFNQHASTIIDKLTEKDKESRTHESSDEEDELDDNSIISSMMIGYTGNREEMQKTLDLIQNCCRSGGITCLICIGGVRHADPMWSCQFCNCIFHLACISKWAKEGSVHIKRQLSIALFPHQEIKWLCPNCRNEYCARDCPEKYYCFCRKTLDPKVNPWLVPHSCGEICKRFLQPECGHRCQLLCHPGACPPCPKMVRSNCYCGNGGVTVRRCGRREWSCNQSCGKLLSCKKHVCDRYCHPGDCFQCEEVEEKKCRCGKEAQHRPCGEEDWQCDRKCDKVLSCGFHRCERVCHGDECGDCPRSGQRSCPCGKAKHTLPCTQDIPTCGDTCGKVLDCGNHRCTERCHYGDCGNCRQMVTKCCRCGKHHKSLQCHQDFICDSRCHVMRDCGRHTCNKRCCSGNCPPCEQTCGRSLSCKNHKCQARCHGGPCYPCHETVDVKCFCQAASITVPCGRERFVDPPKCKELCRIPPKCHHEQRDSHTCHFGQCPPCRQICTLKLETCDHTCPEICHSAVAVVEKLTALQKTLLKKGEKPALMHKSSPCPPCIVPITQKCLGEHEERDFPCHQLRPYSCGRTCERLLRCTNHHCARECHFVTGAEDDSNSGVECVQCEEGCLKPRPRGCEHECTLPCHPGNCPVCKKFVEKWCHCGLVLLHIECNVMTSADTKKKLLILSCQGECPRKLVCGHPCDKGCHPNGCPSWESCKKKRTVRCSCKRLKKALACSSIPLNYNLDCNEECERIKEEKKQLEEKLAQEREEKIKHLESQEEELANRPQGRRRRRKKVNVTSEEDVDMSWSTRHPLLLNIIWFLVVICVLMGVGAISLSWIS